MTETDMSMRVLCLALITAALIQHVFSAFDELPNKC